MAYQRTTFTHRLLNVGRALMLLGVVVIEVVNCSEAGGPRINHISWWLAVGLAAGVIGLTGIQRRMAERRRKQFLSDAINTAVRSQQLSYAPTAPIVVTRERVGANAIAN